MSPKLSSFSTTNDVHCKTNIFFQQHNDNHHFTRIDGIEKPTEGYPLGRRFGLRAQGDRTIVSKAWFGVQQHQWHQQSPYQALYFEVEIVNGSGPMRIGLVHQDWDKTRPPGSLQGSIGYCSDDGNLSIGSKYDERYLFGPTWGQGDIIGCGYYKLNSTGRIFFTKNGVWVGDSPESVDTDRLEWTKRWHCAFSSTSHAEISVRFDDFKYPVVDGIAPFLRERYVLPLSIPQPLFTSTEYCQVSQDRGTMLDFYGVNEARSIQANLPFTQYGKSNYYEIMILEKSFHPHAFLSIGLAYRPYSSFHHIGWNTGSIGYHSDDGHIFQDSYNSNLKISDGFGIGTVVGCGFDPVTQTVFFTQDKRRLHEMKLDIAAPLYISIAATHPWKLLIK
jgi:hypothetical protein